MKSYHQSTGVPANPSQFLSMTFRWASGFAVALFLSAATGLTEQVAAPEISPPAGEYSPDPVDSGNPPVTLTMTSATPGATIYYIIRDTDAGDILTYLPPYDPENPPRLTAPGTKYVRARALKDGMEQSELVSQQYLIHAPVIELFGFMSFGQVAINTTPEPKVFSIKNTGNLPLKIGPINMETADPGAWSYEFVGLLELPPTQTALVKVTFAPTEVKSYSVVFTVESNAVNGANTRSASGSGFDPTKVATPTITLTGGEIHFAPQEVWLGSGTAGAALYYTLDGSDPTEASSLYDPVTRITLTELGEYTLKVRGYKDGLTTSDIASKTFTVVERELTATDSFFFDTPVKIGEYQDKTLVLTNVGSRPIDITLIKIEDEHWSVPDWTGSVTIPVGGVANYTVRFSPTERFDLFGSMTISTNANGGDLTRTLNGFGMPSDYGVDPATKNVPGEGASYSVYVTGPDTWTASEILDWVSIVATPSLGMLVVTVSPNTTGMVRTGNVAVGARTHGIVQAAIDEPLIGGTPVEGLQDWFLSDWFGYYNTTMAPWLFHDHHGFLYRFPQSTNASMFAYDDAMTAWWWTSESIYPFLYVFDPPADNAAVDIGSEWVWYFEDTKTPRSFGVVTGPHGGEFLAFDP